MKSANITGRVVRYETVDVARGIAIVLVVIGHFNMDGMPSGLEAVKDFIYLFHMPLFMMMSGFLLAATWRDEPYGKFLSRKFKRLMVPYFVTSLILFGIKIAFARVMPLDHPVNVSDFVAILYEPVAGGFLWFVWALWWMMVIIPAFRTPGLRLGLLVVAVGLHFVEEYMPLVFCIRQFFDNLVFFMSGVCACDYMRKMCVTTFAPWIQWVTVIIFLLLAVDILWISPEAGSVWRPVRGLICALTGSWATLVVARQIVLRSAKWCLGVVYSISGASYFIYLFHTTFEAFAKGVIVKLHVVESAGIWGYGAAEIVCVACGVAIPWWLATQVLNRSRLTAKLFGLKGK
ncbi:MAG: acyltransferase [Muribaculaceae bacterium]|nr:acyltransferase [Muribaculaceae bacterium]